MKTNTIHQGDALKILKTLPAGSVDMVITSPPYWSLRDYGIEGQIGLEPTYGEYLQRLMLIFDEVKRVLKETGTCWVNIDDTYGTGSGSGVRHGKQSTNRGTQTNKGWQQKGKAAVKGQEKSLLLIPARFALAMVERGWILRNEIIWHKPNTMPESVKDRFTVDFESLFFFVKNKRYTFNQQFEDAHFDGRRHTKMNGSPKYQKGVVPGRKAHTMASAGHERWMQDKTGNYIRNMRSVWKISVAPFPDAHFAIYPEKLVETPIKAGSPEKGVVLDPFMGSGTTAVVAKKLGRAYVGVELNPDYIGIAERRLAQL